MPQSINANWNTIKTIIQNGIDAGDDIAYGSTYKIVVTQWCGKLH